MSKYGTLFLTAALLSACATVSQPSSALEPQPGDFTASNFAFKNGASLPVLALHYTTFGRPQFDASGRCINAVLLLHDTTGETALQAGQFFTAPAMREALFGPGQPLDASQYYIIIPDALGHGRSSKPSNGLRKQFPNYNESDVVEAQYRLVTDGLSINHLKLVLGVAGGGLQTWLWGERYPDMMDTLMPIASAPTSQGGRTGLWQRMATQAIYTDPDWQQGNYVKQPKEWLNVVALSNLVERNALNLQQAASTPEQVEKMAVDRIKSAYKVWDANDALYAFEASKKAPNPEPELAKIKARVYALYFEDDALQEGAAQQMRPRIEQSPRSRVIEIQQSAQTDGHATIARPEVWKTYIQELLTESDRPTSRVQALPKPKSFSSKPLENTPTFAREAAVAPVVHPIAPPHRAIAPAQPVDAPEMVPLPSASAAPAVNKTAAPAPMTTKAPTSLIAPVPAAAVAKSGTSMDGAPDIETAPANATEQDMPAPEKESASISPSNVQADTPATPAITNSTTANSTPADSTTVWSSDPGLGSTPASPMPQNTSTSDAVAISPIVTSEPLSAKATITTPELENPAQASGSTNTVSSQSNAAQQSAPVQNEAKPTISSSFEETQQEVPDPKIPSSKQTEASPAGIRDADFTPTPPPSSSGAPVEAIPPLTPSPVPEAVKTPTLPTRKATPESEQSIDATLLPIPQPLK